MGILRARVVKGRLVLDEPTDLPDGTVVDLFPDDGSNDLDDDERAERDAAIEKGWDEYQAGRSRPASEIIAELKSRSSR